MDSQAQQQKVDQLTAQVSADQNTLSADQTALTQASAELADITLINQLEALTPDQVTTINSALSTDPDNHLGISLTVPNGAPAA